MNVSRRFALLFVLGSLLISTFVSYSIFFYNRHSDHHLQLLAGLCIVLIFIGISGKLLHYQHMLRRVTQNLEEAQQLAGLGIWERDLASGRGYWSDNCYRLFDLPPRTEAPSMEEFLLMIHAEDRALVREAVTNAISSSGSYEVRYRTGGDAGNRFFLSRGKVLRDDSGKPVTLVGSIQDITHKQRRDQFREGLIKQKDLFINRLGHDLKTPLTPLVALLPLIRSRTDDRRQQELLDLCIRNVNHMRDLVVKTLQLARLASSGDDVSRHVDMPLSAAVDSAISSLAPSFEGHLTVEQRIPADMTVRGNPEELQEVFVQLLRNAVTFSPAGSLAIVEATRDAATVSVTVRDDGIGLLPEEVQHLFEDFYKADPSRHALDSSGLGLAICRKIVENHGGRISASSPGRDGGTAVTFTLKAGGGA